MPHTMLIVAANDTKHISRGDLQTAAVHMWCSKVAEVGRLLHNYSYI